jgi:AIR synthase related protein
MTTSDGFVDRASDKSSPTVHRFRDILYWVDGGNAYVLACDSNAGIGQRPNDMLRQTPFETGYSAAKVPLLEVLATGAVPFVLTNALGGPRDDYGQQLLAGISAAIAEVDAEVALTGSDETNAPTKQTAVGVSVVGRAPVTELRLRGAEPGDVILVVGLPKDGLLVPYTEGDQDIANLRDLQAVARLTFVHELLPVGSRGIAFEAGELAAGASGTVRFRDGVDVDLDASAGSSTCFLVALPPGHAADVAALVRPQVTELADIVGPGRQ